jgi:arylformamidase
LSDIEGWLDVSVEVRPDTPPWPGDTPFDCRWAWAMAQGASVNVSCLTGSPHVGTHADAPLHVRNGAPGSHMLPLDAFNGAAWVSDVRTLQGELSVADLHLPDTPVARLVLRTGACIAEGHFPEAWPSLGDGALSTLLARGLRLLAVDAPSVDDRDSKTLRNHHLLFDGGACVLENLDLRAIEAGGHALRALPIRYHGLDATPVRALLRRHRQ